MDYRKVNQALCTEFGAGNVEVRKAKDDQSWEFTLWFLDDNPAPSVVDKAKEIVGRFETTKWYDELMFHSE